MINFDRQFTFEPNQPSGWQLHEWYDGKDKDGNPVRQHRTTYWESLRQVCGAVLERTSRECESAEELRNLLQNAEDILLECVENQTE